MTNPFVASRSRTVRSSLQIAAGLVVWVSSLVLFGCAVNGDGLGALARQQDGAARLPETGGTTGAASGGASGNRDAPAPDGVGTGGSSGQGGSGSTILPMGATGGSARGGAAGGGSGGNTSGVDGTGGMRATGASTTGPVAKGGATSEGGATGSGGVPAEGGTTGDGGVSGTGGLTRTGGAGGGGGTRGRGGATGAGGRTGRGGATGTGGSTTCVLGPFQPPELITGLGLEGYDFWGPALSADGSTLYFAASNNLTADDIYTATRSGRDVRFSAAVALEGVNTNSADGSPSVSRDGLTLYFYSTRLGGFGGRDLWTASRSQAQGAFGTARLLANVNGGQDDNLQWVSEDELTMVFSSGRSGESDLYVARRSSREDDFSHPNSLGGVNGVTTREDRAAISNDGFTIYFTSDRTGGRGDKDIWVGTRTDVRGNFGDFTDLQAVNGPQRDIDVFLSAEETELLISSNRSGRFQLYRSLRKCE